MVLRGWGGGGVLQVRRELEWGMVLDHDLASQNCGILIYCGTLVFLAIAGRIFLCIIQLFLLYNIRCNVMHTVLIDRDA